jgi:hypothetical protein
MNFLLLDTAFILEINGTFLLISNDTCLSGLSLLFFFADTNIFARNLTLVNADFKSRGVTLICSFSTWTKGSSPLFVIHG